MSFKPRHIDDLIEELGSPSKARSLLREAGIDLIGDGWYDHGAIEAMFAEPKLTNIGKPTKNLFTLAPTDGLGAIKVLTDRIGVDISRHTYRGTNWLTLRNEQGRRVHCKVHTASGSTARSKRSMFTVSGLHHETGPAYYFFVCFEGPIGWVIRRRELQRALKELEAGHKPTPAGTFYLPHSNSEGKLVVRPDFDSPYMLLTKKQFGI